MFWLGEPILNILAVGDVVGKSGRRILLQHIADLRESLSIDLVVVNGENAAHGFGITEKICQSFFQSGVDVITTGNHVWDQRSIINYIDKDPRLIRPINYPVGTPGQGFVICTVSTGKKVLVAQAMCRLFMETLDEPFIRLEKVLQSRQLGAEVCAIVIDVHGEATSEKQAFGEIFDGRASLVFGTHTHVPTADYRILPRGTAFITDVGMTGDYDSIIGMEKKVASQRFVKKTTSSRLTPADGMGTLCGVFVQTNDVSGLAENIEPIRVGGHLRPTRPILGFKNIS